MPRAGLLALALVAAAGLGVIASGCSSSSSEGVARADTTETTTTEPGSSGRPSSADPAAFSACIRSHGLPNFPDPDSNGELPPPGADSGYDPESPQGKSAWHACRELVPSEKEPTPAEKARDQARLLKFAACMRAHGLPKFPDPNPEGGISVNKNSGIDRNSAQFKEAEEACEDLLPGARGGGENA
jgi:hypothetical protein